MSSGGAFDFKGTDRFQVSRSIGSGGMGVVYEALDTQTNDKIALKTLRQLDAHSLYRFKSEFRALQDLVHPNLVSLYELIQAEGHWFFTMELIDGDDFLTFVRRTPVCNMEPLAETAAFTPRALAQKQNRTRPEKIGHDVELGFNEQRLRAALPGLVAGVNALHKAGKVHRDVKPTNVLVSKTGRVVLLDFGLTVEASAALSMDGSIVGTAAYMAPEQAAAKPVGPEADWYAVGALLYEALTGRLPFVGSSLEILMEKQRSEPPAPRTIMEEVPDDLSALCAALLKFEPSERPRYDDIIRILGVEHSPKPAQSESYGSGIRTFVGRPTELAALRRAFDDTRQGEAVTVYVHGESGIGKSALIRQFVETVNLARTDVVVLAGRCYEQEQVPYKALDGVVDALCHYMRMLSGVDATALQPRCASMLPLLFPVLGRVEAITQAPPIDHTNQGPHQLRARLFNALRELFERLAQRQALIIVIDDLQWADADSEVLLTDLMRPPEAPPLLLLISSREAPETSAGGRLPGDVRTLEVPPLSPDMSRELTSMLLTRAGIGKDTNPALISADARGHPLFIDELVRHAAISGATDPSGLRLDEAIWGRVCQLPKPARNALELIALAGAPLSHDVLSYAAQMKSSDFGRPLSLLRAANLVRRRSTEETRFEPFHNRVREAVLANLDADTKRAHHARIAIALQSAPSGTVRPQLLLRHLESAGQPERAAECAVEGAQRAARVLAFDQATELYSTALRVGSHSGEPERRLRVSLAEALANAGRGVEAADEYLEAAEGADRVTRRECQRIAAQQLLIAGHIERGVDTLNALLVETGVTLPASPRRALAALVAQRIKLRLRGLRFKAKHEREIADADLARLDLFQVVGNGMAMVDNIKAAVFQTRTLRLALRLGERQRIAHALTLESIFLGSQGGRGHHRAKVLIDHLKRLAEADPDPKLRGYAVAGEGVWCYVGGDFSPASEHLETAEEIFRDETVGTQNELNNIRLFRMFTLRHLGSVAEASRLQAEYVRDAERRGDLYASTTFRRSGGRLWLARDEAEAALAYLEETSWTPPEEGFHMQHWYELEARSELALYKETTAEMASEFLPRFEAMRQSLLLRIQILRTAAHWLLGRFWLTLSADPNHRDRVRAQVSSLARKLAREKPEYATAWAQLLRAGLHCLAGDLPQTIQVLRQAIECAERTSMGLVAATARRRLGGLLSNDEGQAMILAADTWMRGEGIVNPQQMTAMIVPLPAASS